MQHMPRAPFALERMTYDPATRMVIYCRKLHVSLKQKIWVTLSAKCWSCSTVTFPIDMSPWFATTAGTTTCREAITARDRKENEPQWYRMARTQPTRPQRNLGHV